ncbi:MAG TPA: hypothetical protein O0Y17_02090 [Methanocorpusculum sp.]|nr:hypothetical protein [Methanocorpusculum sp.]
MIKIASNLKSGTEPQKRKEEYRKSGSTNEEQKTTAASEKLVTLEIRTAKTRKDLAYREPKLHTETFTRWTQVPELQNKQSLEVMLDQYRDVKLAAYVLNCSRHMVYAAMDHHGITFPRVYSSKRTKQQVGLQSTLSPGLKERQNRS